MRLLLLFSLLVPSISFALVKRPYGNEMNCAVYSLHPAKVSTRFPLKTLPVVKGVSVGDQTVQFKGRSYRFYATVYSTDAGGIMAMTLTVSEIGPNLFPIWRARVEKDAPHHDLVGKLTLSRFIDAADVEPGENFYCQPLFM